MRRIWVIVAIVIPAISIAAYAAHRYINHEFRSRYCGIWAGQMVVAHLRANGDAWPRSWSELTDDYEALVAEVGPQWELAELCERIEIDWSADVADLRRLAHQERPLAVIRRADGKMQFVNAHDPNRMVRDYLRSRPD